MFPQSSRAIPLAFIAALYSAIWLSGTQAGAQSSSPASNPFIGNWALALPNGSAGWLSLMPQGNTLTGELWTVGAPKPINEVSISNGQLTFFHRRAVGKREYEGGPPTGKKIPCRHTARIIDDTMRLVMDRPTEDRIEKVNFTGQRIAPLPPKPDLTAVRFGAPIELFNGQDLTGWRLTNPGQKNGWKAVNGELVNETPKKTFDPYAHYGNLRTDQEFEDFQLTLEFKVPPGGNSGIYLRGLYEAQVVDRDSRMQGLHGVGSIFNRIAPSGNHGKPGNQWQHYDITLVDRHITVILNGVEVIDNQALVGCTNGALQANDSLPGPLYLQGDHTAVAYRNIVVRPVVTGRSN
jgi:hypothetical protein